MLKFLLIHVKYAELQRRLSIIFNLRVNLKVKLRNYVIEGLTWCQSAQAVI